ncbi:TPA: hypothetical protein OTT45_000713, partial [Escherichia coli]|nr:hypothetical protein [Escherichia coli]
PFAVCRVLMLMVERSGSAREVAPEARWLRLVGGGLFVFREWPRWPEMMVLRVVPHRQK